MARYKDDMQNVLDERELSIERTRQFMTLFANTNKGKNTPAFTPQDFWRVSYDDKPQQETKALSFKEVKELLGARIKKENG